MGVYTRCIENPGATGPNSTCTNGETNFVVYTVHVNSTNVLKAFVLWDLFSIELVDSEMFRITVFIDMCASLELQIRIIQPKSINLLFGRYYLDISGQRTV